MNQQYSQIAQDMQQKQFELLTIIQKMPVNTILVVTSDHGNIKRGGSGGDETEVQDVPLMVYQKSSGFQEDEFSYGQNREYELIDVAATLSALMGQ